EDIGDDLEDDDGDCEIVQPVVTDDDESETTEDDDNDEHSPHDHIPQQADLVSSSPSSGDDSRDRDSEETIHLIDYVNGFSRETATAPCKYFRQVSHVGRKGRKVRREL